MSHMASPLCTLGESERENVLSAVSLSFYNDSRLLDWTPSLRSQLTLITFLKALSPNTVVIRGYGVRVST